MVGLINDNNVRPSRTLGADLTASREDDKRDIRTKLSLVWTATMAHYSFGMRLLRCVINAVTHRNQVSKLPVLILPRGNVEFSLSQL